MTKSTRFEFRTTPEFLARIDAIRGKISRAAVIEQLCDYALKAKSPPAPASFLIGNSLSR